MAQMREFRSFRLEDDQEYDCAVEVVLNNDVAPASLHCVGPRSFRPSLVLHYRVTLDLLFYFCKGIVEIPTGSRELFSHT